MEFAQCRSEVATTWPRYRCSATCRGVAAARSHAGAVRLEVPAGHVLFDEDSEGHEFVAVLGGEVEVRRDGAVVAELSAGDYLGEGAVLTRTHRNASAVARTDATIVCIGASDFEDVEARWPAVAEEIRATASQRLTTR